VVCVRGLALDNSISRVTTPTYHVLFASDTTVMDFCKLGTREFYGGARGLSLWRAKCSSVLIEDL